MSNDPDQIREGIERTRAELSADVDRLADEVNPKHMAQRQVGRLTGRARDLKDTVMGSASSAGGSVASLGSTVGSTVGDAADSVGDAPAAVRSRTRGNPLAAGFIAFGAGALLASLMPATAVESQVADAAKEKAKPLTDELADVAKDSAQHLKSPAQEAARSVRDSAADAARNVKDEGSSAAHDVRGDAESAAQEVKASR